MANDPGFVRLTRRLTGQIWADIDSGFSISGLDVQPFPKGDEKARAARRALNTGVLEEASRAEYDEVQDANKVMSEARQFSDDEKDYQRSYQEHLVAEKHAEALEKVRKVRAENDEADPDEYEAMVERRKALLEEQKELGLDTDDPEEQVSRQVTGRTRKSTAKRQQPAASGSSDDDE